MVEVSLTVGKLDASLALLLTKDHHLIEFPTILLPDDAEAGSVVKITCEKDSGAEKQEEDSFQKLQKELLETYGTAKPKAPVLSAKNITQTSVVLEWDPIEIAQADIKKLVLLRDGIWCGHIPKPLVRTATKLSGFGVEKNYTFQLVLYTTAGTYESNLLEIETHSMTDLRGITVCVGEIDANMTTVTEAEIDEALEDIHAKPVQSEVKLDTTHFVCTKAQGAQWEKAVDMNIPVVLPEWLRACQMDKKMVNVRNFYLDSDPKHRSQYKRAAGAPSSPSIRESIRSTEPAHTPAEPAPVESTPAATEPALDRSNTRHSIFTEGATEAEEIAEDPLNAQLESEVAANDVAESLAEVDLDGPSGEPDPDTVDDGPSGEPDPDTVDDGPSGEPDPDTIEEEEVEVVEPVEPEAEEKAEEVKEPEDAVTTDSVEPVEVEVEEKAEEKTEPEPVPETVPETKTLTDEPKPTEPEPETKTEPEETKPEETKPDPETLKSPSQLADEFAEVSLDDSKTPEETTEGDKDEEDGDEDDDEDDKQEDSKPAASSNNKKKNKKNKKKGKK